MSKVIALIPARSGSKGVLNKNIRQLAGRPLLAWTIAACRKTRSIDRVIVSTDSLEYAALAREWGAEAPFLRPAEISGDRSSDYEFVIHALDCLADEGDSPDFIVHMRPTTPLRESYIIEKAVQEFVENRSATAMRSVHKMTESAYKAFEMAPTGQLRRLGSDNTELDSANNARQQFPVTYEANGYVDVLSTAFIRNNGLIHGDRVMPFVTQPVVEVDTEEEFAYLEFLVVRNPKFVSNIFE